MTAALADPAVDLDVDLAAAIPCRGLTAGIECDLPATWRLTHRCDAAQHHHLYCDVHTGGIIRRLNAGYRTYCGQHQSWTVLVSLVRL